MIYFWIALVLLAVRISEAAFGFRKSTAKWGDFSGAALLGGSAWTPLTSSLLHNSLVHTLKQAIVLLLIGQAVEQALGSSSFVFAYFLGGALGCIVSWRMLRRKLLSDPSYPTNTPEEVKNVAFLADNCPSRGASACTYTCTALALVVCGDAYCELSNLGISNQVVQRWLIIVGALLPETLSVATAQEEQRINGYWSAYALLVAFIGNCLLPAQPRVSDTVTWWWAVIIANHYVRLYMSPRNKINGAGVIDWQSHLIGVIFGAIWGLSYAIAAGDEDEHVSYQTVIPTLVGLLTCACSAVLH
jgi:membrane associated rhomboid family serine protease